MEKLKSSLITKKIVFNNRLIFPPIATNMADEEGEVTEKLLQYYEKKSQGGYLSMIITEHCFISEQGRAVKRQISIADDRMVKGMASLVRVIHRGGVKVAAQINHAGALGVSGKENAAPSVICDEGHIRPGKIFVSDHELEKREIEAIVQEFARAAARAKEAGCDAVEIHAAHGYLLNEFYSPLTNLRKDEYGGTLSGRIRIHLEVIRAVREAVGADYPILLRFGAVDYTEGGSTLADAVEACEAFEKAGVDILDISGGLTGYEIKGREKEQGYFKEVTQAIKEKVSIPVILTGGITEVETADELLVQEKADLIGIGRALLRNPSLVKERMEKNRI